MTNEKQSCVKRKSMVLLLYPVGGVGSDACKYNCVVLYCTINGLLQRYLFVLEIILRYGCKDTTSQNPNVRPCPSLRLFLGSINFSTDFFLSSAH